MTPPHDMPETLRLDGELDIYRAAQLKPALLDALAACAPGATLEIDLSAVAGIDTAGVQVLMLAQKTAVQSGRALRLVAPSSAVTEVLGLLNLSSWFGIAPAT